MSHSPSSSPDSSSPDSARRAWASLALGLAGLGYGALFIASLFTPIYAYDGSGWVLSGVERIWPLLSAAISLAILVVLHRPRGGLTGWLFVGWATEAVLATALFNVIWGAQALLTALVALALSWPFVSWPRPGSRTA